MNDDYIEKLLRQRYPGSGCRRVVRDQIASACYDFVQSGFADSNFTEEICSGLEQKFWSRVSEALLFAHLKNIGLSLELPFAAGGPDFLLINNGRKIWIEAICPEPTGIPSEWLQPKIGTAISFPHEQILLRWTSAIKEKAERLLGSSDDTVKGYIQKGIVSTCDGYVIAVNGCQLRSGAFSALFGISQFPFAVEAVFALGPYQITIDRNTLKQIGSSHQHRPLIPKPKGKPVPADTFRDPRFEPISAIWAVDITGTLAIGNSEPMVVVHNPHACNPIPIGLLPAHYEYLAIPIGTEDYELRKLEGNLTVLNQ